MVGMLLFLFDALFVFVCKSFGFLLKHRPVGFLLVFVRFSFGFFWTFCDFLVDIDLLVSIWLPFGSLLLAFFV